MLNMGQEDLPMTVQMGKSHEWRCVLDTARPAPKEIVGEREAPRLDTDVYTVRVRSVVVLVRDRDGDGRSARPPTPA